ncbi:BrnA antitoxin family protein [Falsirhodobacter sp. 20TX0035]|uniref:BrnA antitoxin family protein n=1 Tax=Falsirhodobacter sp. 20TX0035 TaxID=3022019 RepID=UPI00232D26E7|nr:BrnA antitoxin family protein [Falsirhodobacter sp. 20TX0035]MDB6454148.1 BrnA antitoxin family protein [Falsirhodobacter sp. 20TX0035]
MPRPTVTDSDNPEWTSNDFARAKPVSELPAHIRAAFPRTRGLQKATTKVPVSIRLSADVVEHFKAGGPGWQSRIDEALRKVAGV